MATTHRTFLILAMVSLGLSGACRHKNDQGPTAKDLPQIFEQPELRMEKVHFQVFGTDSLQWEMTAPLAQAFTTKNYIKGEDLYLTLYAKKKPSTTIRADHGTVVMEESDPTNPNAKGGSLKIDGVNLKKGDMFLKGHVVVISTDGSNLETEWLWFQKNRNIVTSTAPVRLVKDNTITQGIGLQATSTLSSVKIFKQTVTIKDEENGYEQRRRE